MWQNILRISALGSLLGLALVVVGYQRRGSEIGVLEGNFDKLRSDDAEQMAKLKMKLIALERSGNLAPPAAPNQETGKGRPKPVPEDHFRSLRKDPIFAALWHKRQLRNVQRLFGDSIAAMNLPAGDVAKLRELLIARTNAQVDSRDVSREAGLSPEQANLAVAQATDELNAEIKALIGDDNFVALQKPPASLFKPMIENSVGLDLAMAGFPLTSTQTKLLAQSFSPMFTPRPLRNAGNQTPDPETGLTPFYQIMLDQVAPALSTDQIPAVKDYLVERMQEQVYATNAVPVAAPSP